MIVWESKVARIKSTQKKKNVSRLKAHQTLWNLVEPTEAGRLVGYVLNQIEVEVQ